MRRSLTLACLSGLSLLLLALAGVPPKALELRDLGLAQLENERPAEAEATFAELVKAAPEDPLGYANLAVAALRQQESEAAIAWIDKALAKAPDRPDLLALRGEIRQWAGGPEDAEGALADLEKAAAAATDDPEIQFAAYRLAGSAEGERAGRLAAAALERLAKLRPENLVVLLARGSRAVAAGDRAAATAAYLRVRELLWQAPPQAASTLDPLLAALEGGDTAAARLPALRLENVLKILPMYQGGLRELWRGIQGVPVARFRDEPTPADFGAPVPIRLQPANVDFAHTPGSALAAADFDGDKKSDLARIALPQEGGQEAGQEGKREAGGAGKPDGTAVLEVRLAGRGFEPATFPAPAGLAGLAAADLDNDGAIDLLAFGGETAALAVFKGDGKGGFAAANEAFGLAGTGATAAAVLDFDIEGDLDLVLAGVRKSGKPAGPAGPAGNAGETGDTGTAGLELYRNSLAGPLEAVGARTFPQVPAGGVRAVLASDLDRDGDVDLLLVRPGAGAGLVWLDNLRQGRFADRTADGGLGGAPAALAAASADLDSDGLPDLVVAPAKGPALLFFRNVSGKAGGRFEPWELPLPRLAADTRLVALAPADLDNDGRLDLAASDSQGLLTLLRRPGGEGFVQGPTPPMYVTAVAPADLDADGDLDLAAAGPVGLLRVTNQGGNKNHWLDVRLKGLTKGNSKNNSAGLGATAEVRAGTAYQFREMTGDVEHFGLGARRQADVLRVVWTNGVPQNRLAVAGDQAVVEEQILKGSCPFLYTWTGERTEFVTDLLWAAPIGLPVAPGVWAGADPTELVRVDGAAPRDGRYLLSVTEELWEAAFFDRVRLWVVDHPAAVEVASNLRVLPGRQLPEEVRASRNLQPVAAAWDGQGREATARVARRDDIYADGYRMSAYQGAAAAAWTFTFDLGRAPGRAVRLHLDGWIFPADASLNLALAQRPDLSPPLGPRLEVETAAGWRVLVPEMGFPAGKTKTMVVDTPPLPPGARRLRVVTSLWISWDRIAWTTAPDDGAARVVARLAPESADLRYRGFSAPVRRAPNAPHGYDYGRVETDSPWLPFPGRYTRYGDVRELLEEADDRSVILAAGDEMALAFDASALPPPAPGIERTLFLESAGWDKDADRNTWEPRQMEPLPFRAMSGYPPGPGESFPDTPLLLRYREEWLTREVR